ncbi:hypothetical protein M9H77_07047 [Catharanthus roseus]|uniref:Uncharacterized protein n=1 Tax=Catharanthus roseus TaxID=4058 RepID=A0ACC0BU26_CATRO|nr:hypothetical protein M9H77_07047 [Catharanthus roseus]
MVLEVDIDDYEEFVKENIHFERGGANLPRTKSIIDDEEEEVQVKWRGPYGTKKCGYPFKLKGKQMAMCENRNAQKIYNVTAKIKKNRMLGRNMVEEVLCLSAKQGYTAFYRNPEGSNVLSGIVVAHPTSIEMIRMWPYFSAGPQSLTSDRAPSPASPCSSGKGFAEEGQTLAMDRPKWIKAVDCESTICDFFLK